MVVGLTDGRRGRGLRASGQEHGGAMASGIMHIPISIAPAVSTSPLDGHFYAFHRGCGKRWRCSRLVKPV